MDKNPDYQNFASHLVRNLPTESKLTELIESFYFEAALNMGANTTKKDTSRDISRIVYLVRTDFSGLPVSVVASAFIRGSLGKLDPGRLVPRTVFNWLNEVADEYRRKEEHKELQKSLSYKTVSCDLHRYPVGQAINKKIEWLLCGAINEEDYDKIPLRDLSERIATGMLAVPELFGVETRNKQKI